MSGITKNQWIIGGIVAAVAIFFGYRYWKSKSVKSFEKTQVEEMEPEMEEGSFNATGSRIDKKKLGQKIKIKAYNGQPMVIIYGGAHSLNANYGEGVCPPASMLSLSSTDRVDCKGRKIVLDAKTNTWNLV